ncbi:SH3 domain-containing protein [Chloroflexi bacterium TSY]|nr:SH3 domain-containing protein [Chloroflexi bacterium TSY]
MMNTEVQRLKHPLFALAISLTFLLCGWVMMAPLSPAAHAINPSIHQPPSNQLRTVQVQTELTRTETISEASNDVGSRTISETTPSIRTVGDLRRSNRSNDVPEAGSQNVERQNNDVRTSSETDAETATEDNVEEGNAEGDETFSVRIRTDGRNLNLRSGPGTDFRIVGSVSVSTVVQVLEVAPDNAWYRIALDSEDEFGWLFAQFTEPIEEIEITETDVDNESDDPTEFDGTNSNPNEASGTEDASKADIEASSTITSSDPSSTVEPSTPITPSVTTAVSTTLTIGMLRESGKLGTTKVKPETTNEPTTTTTTAVIATTDISSQETISPTQDLVETEQISGTAPFSDGVAIIDNALISESVSISGTIAISDTLAISDAISVSDTIALSNTILITESLQTTVTVVFDTPTAVTQPANMNVRAGPGTNYGIVSVAPSGSQYEILGLNPQGDWYQVHVKELDEPAWLYAPLVEALGPINTIKRLSDDDIPEPPPPPPTPEPSLAVVPVNAPPPSGAGFFGYGVQAHMLGGGIDQALNATSDLGFNWIKQQVEWYVFEGQPGALDFSELRRIVDAAGARGISVLFSVVNSPEWAREGGFDPNVGGPPADPQTYANFVGRLAGDFCGTALRAVEVWNEQNLHYEWGNKPLNPAEYMNLLRAAYGSIKAACPSMLVISGAPTPAGSNGNFAMDDFAYLEGMYQNGLANYADGVGVHPSGYNVPPSVRHETACEVIQNTGNFFNGACDTPHHSWSFRSTMEGYRNIMIVYGDTNKRLWLTEFGWAAGGAYDPRYAYANDNDFGEQAAWTVEAFQMMRNWGWVGPAFLWNLNFRVVADGTEKAQWGIVRNDYSPLPVYEALRGMAK